MCYTPGCWGIEETIPKHKGEAMPGPSPHALIWSQAQQQYELITDGHPDHCFKRGDEPALPRWLDEHTAFAFLGQAGRLSVLKEARDRGAGYWYAYRTQARHTYKRYLGSTTSMTFARLEAVAKELSDTFSSAPRRSAQEELERVREASRGRLVLMGCFSVTSLFEQKRQRVSSELAADSSTGVSRSRWKLSNGEWLLWPSRTRSS